MEVYALESLCSGQAAILPEAQASVESNLQSRKAQRKDFEALKAPAPIMHYSARPARVSLITLPLLLQVISIF